MVFEFLNLYVRSVLFGIVITDEGLRRNVYQKYFFFEYLLYLYIHIYIYSYLYIYSYMCKDSPYTEQYSMGVSLILGVISPFLYEENASPARPGSER